VLEEHPSRYERDNPYWRHGDQERAERVTCGVRTMIKGAKDKNRPRQQQECAPGY